MTALGSRSFSVPAALLDEIDASLKGTVESFSSFAARAVAHQLEEWEALELDLVDPLSGDRSTKSAGAPFPPWPELPFPRGRRRRLPSLAEGDDVDRVTMRLDEDLLNRWLAGVWWQLHRYDWMSSAMVEALETELRR